MGKQINKHVSRPTPARWLGPVLKVRLTPWEKEMECSFFVVCRNGSQQSINLFIWFTLWENGDTIILLSICINNNTPGPVPYVKWRIHHCRWRSTFRSPRQTRWRGRGKWDWKRDNVKTVSRRQSFVDHRHKAEERATLYVLTSGQETESSSAHPDKQSNQYPVRSKS